MMQVSSEAFNSLVQERDELENRCDRLADIIENTLTQHEETTEHAETWRRLYLESSEKLENASTQYGSEIVDLKRKIVELETSLTKITEHNYQIAMVRNEAASSSMLNERSVDIISEMELTLSAAHKENAVLSARLLNLENQLSSSSPPAAVEDEVLVADVLGLDAEVNKAVKANENLRAAFFIINEETNAVRAAVFGSKRKAKGDPDRFEGPSVEVIDQLTDALLDGDDAKRESCMQSLNALNEEIISSFRKAVATQNAMAMKAFSDNKQVEKPNAVQIATLAERRPVSASASKRPASRGPLGAGTPVGRATPSAAITGAARGRIGFPAVSMVDNSPVAAPMVVVSQPAAVAQPSFSMDDIVFE